MRDFRKFPELWIYAFLLLVALAVTLPFLNHAYHIDEPLFLRIARQIQSEPLNPYGFYYQWNLAPEPVHRIAAFPPIFSYFLAAVSLGRAFPPEWWIHLSLVPFAAISVSCTYALARQLGYSQLESVFGAVLLAVSPAFVVSANLAMPDTATLAFALLATLLAIQGWKTSRQPRLVASGLCLGTACLLRYNAIPLVLILGLWGFAYSELKSRALLPSLIGLGMIGIWLALSLAGTGESHTTEVLSVFAKTKGWMSRFWALNIHLSLSTFLPFLLIPWFLRQKFAAWLLVAFLTLDFAVYASPEIKRFALLPDSLFFALGIATLLYLAGLFWKEIRTLGWLRASCLHEEIWHGVQLRLRKVGSLKGNSEWESVMLLLWIGSVLLIPLIYVHFASKYLLLTQPPLILLVLKKLREFPSFRLSRWAWAFAPALALSLAVAHADFQFADLYRTEAGRADSEMLTPFHRQTQSPSRWVWFTGHWGWQYYLEKYGALPLPALFENIQAEDRILSSAFASASELPAGLKKRLREISRRTETLSLPLLTMNPYGRAGFYSNHWGPLPYNFSTAPAEEFKGYEAMPETKRATLP